MAKDNYGLLLAALVAIVAVVGLVILFSNQGSTGAPTIGEPGAQFCACPEGYSAQLNPIHFQHGRFGNRCTCVQDMDQRSLWP